MAYDVVIIGSGPGGYACANECARLGLSVCIVENQELGGVCLNWGCIPTKALLRSAEIYHLMQRSNEFGVTTSDLSFDLEKIVDRSRAVARQLNRSVHHMLRKNKVEVVMGYARLKSKEEVSVLTQEGDERHLKARHIVLATGAHPRSLPFLPFDEKIIWSSKEAMTPKELPSSLLVIGSGAIGVEFASFYNAFGVEVTLVDQAESILPTEDKEISSLAHTLLSSKGIHIYTQSKIEKAVMHPNGAEVVLMTENSSLKTIKVEKVLVAIGIEANIDDIGLDKTNVQVNKGRIVVDAYGQTHEAGIFAIGDITQGPWLAHKATYEGMVVAQKIGGLNPSPAQDIPACIYSLPQIASVGLTEEQALESGYTLKIGKFPYRGNGKAIALGEMDGLIKVIFDEKTGSLLGAHLIGAEVTEMIHSFVLAKKLETTEQEFMQSVFPHPTLSEMICEAVLETQKHPFKA